MILVTHDIVSPILQFHDVIPQDVLCVLCREPKQ
jgi:hypothetical protein